MRQAITAGFEKTYPGIALEYTPVRGGEGATRIQAERRGQVFLVDLHIGGAGPAITGLKDFAAPLEPLLILPEVREGKYWRGGKLEFGDNEEKLVLVFNSTVKAPLAYNSQSVDSKEADALSYNDLIKPDWKGKLLMSDPRLQGPGQTMATFLYHKLGPDYLKALARNDVLLTRDDRLALEWVGRGRYLGMLGASDVMAAELAKAGLPIRIRGAFKEGSVITVGFGTAVYMDRAPHPAAARVYLNWFLSKEGQTAYSRASGQVSRRLDVPVDHLLPEQVPQPEIDYLLDYKEETVVTKRPPAIKLAQELWGR